MAIRIPTNRDKSERRYSSDIESEPFTPSDSVIKSYNYNYRFSDDLFEIHIDETVIFSRKLETREARDTAIELLGVFSLKLETVEMALNSVRAELKRCNLLGKGRQK